MPSALSAGPIKTFLRISRAFRVISGGRLILEPVDALPDNADGEEGELVVYAGELYVHNGTAFVVAGTQT